MALVAARRLLGLSRAIATSAFAQRALNLSDLASAATARTNLALGNVDNTSDVNKPVSTAQATADTAVATAAATDATTKANAAQAASSPRLTRTAVKTGNYSVAAGDFVPCDTTSAAFTVTLPNAPAVGTRVGVKLVTLGAGHAVTIACAGSDVFNKTAGPTTGTLTLLNQALQVQYDTGGIWTVVADDLPLTALNGSYLSTAAGAGLTQGDPKAMTGLKAVSRLVPVAEHAMLGGNQGAVSNGTDTMGQSRLKHFVLVPFTSIVFEDSNFYANADSGEVSGAVNITVKRGLELADGSIIPVTWNGASTVTIVPGQRVYSDPIGVEHAGPTDPNPFIWSRTLITVGSSTWLTNVYASNTARAGEGTEHGTALTDKTGSGTITTGVAAVYGPSAILGTTPAVKPLVLVAGDSIAFGNGSTTSTPTTVDSSNDAGFMQTALRTAGIPFVKIASGGEMASTVKTWTKSVKRRIFAAGATDIIVQHGVNDVRNTHSLATVQADLLLEWTSYAVTGGRVWATTVTPFSNSTDSWATTVNQTPGQGNAAKETVRTSLNAWIRAGAPIDPTTKAAVTVGTVGALVAGNTGHPLTGYFELADAVESARDSGLWKADGVTAFKYSSDGLHPSINGHALLAAAVDTTRFVA